MCDAPHPQFKFPVLDGSVRENERFEVRLPAAISRQGLDAIKNRVYTAARNYDVYTVVDNVEPVWQTKRGNYSKRLAAALSKAGIKLSDELLTEIGNLARQHSTEVSMWIEFTRDLNHPKEYFYSTYSCWWPSASQVNAPRCCLKNWGGFAMRSFETATGKVAGRAWIHPLTIDTLPTHEVFKAQIHVSFNPRGNLEGFVAGRVLAHLTGRTYKKITFGNNSRHYVDSGGLLVADEAIAKKITNINIDCNDEHHKFDAEDIGNEAKNAE